MAALRWVLAVALTAAACTTTDSETSDPPPEMERPGVSGLIEDPAAVAAPGDPVDANRPARARPSAGPGTDLEGGGVDGTSPTAGRPDVHEALEGLAEAVAEAADLAGLLSLSSRFPGFCGVRPGGAVECSDFWRPEDIPAGRFGAVSAGWLTACGLRVDGSVECWGGVRDWSDPAVPAGAFVAVGSGGFRACGLRPGGGLECWTQPVRGLREEEALAWSAAHPGGAFDAVSVGYAHVCGLRPGGAVECWGEDWFGQSTAPGGRFLAVAAGVSHSCGLRPDGSVECWGEDSIDSGFFGFSEDRYEEAYSDPLGPLEDDALSKRERFGVLTLGAAALGEETLGVLVERAAGWEPPGGPYKAISAGAGFTCGLRLDGEVACWGSVAGGEPRIPLVVYAEVAGERVRELHAAKRAEIQRHPGEEDASSQNSEGAGPSPDGSSSSEPDVGGEVGTSLLGLRFELYLYSTVVGQLMVVDPPAGPFVAIDAGFLRACGLRPGGEVECWGPDDPKVSWTPSGRFASEALPVVAPPGALVGEVPAVAGVVGVGDLAAIGGLEAPGEAGVAARVAVAAGLRAEQAGPAPPAAGEVTSWFLLALPPQSWESVCGGELLPGGPLAPLVDPRVADGRARLPPGPFVPGEAVELRTALLRPNSTVRLSMIGGPVPRGGEPLGDAASPVALPPAAADPQGELSLPWTVPAAPAGRLGPMWYLVRGTGVAQLTHHTLDVRLTSPLIVYPDVALCAVDDEATTTAGVAVRVDVLANDIAPSGGTLDPTSVSIVRAAGGEFVANADGSVTFTPEADFTGTARARYTVSDTWNINATANVTVTVKAN